MREKRLFCVTAVMQTQTTGPFSTAIGTLIIRGWARDKESDLAINAVVADAKRRGLCKEDATFVGGAACTRDDFDDFEAGERL